MKTKTKDLLEALKILHPIIGKRNSLPGLTAVRLEARQGRLHLGASDLDQFADEVIDCEGDLEAVAISFNYLLNSLGSETTSITVTKNHAVIKCGRNESRLPYLDAEEFPKLPAKMPTTSIGAACADMAKAIKSVEWCARKEQDPYVLRSVHVIGRAKSLVCEATDKRQLAVNTTALICGDFEMLLPAEFVANLSDFMLRKGSQLLADEDHIEVIHSNGFYLCKQTDGKYPDTSQVIAKDTKLLGKIVVADALDVFARLKNYTVPNRVPVSVMEFSADGILVEFVANAEASYVIPGKYETHEARVHSESFLLCLRGLKADVCEVLQSKNMLILQAGDITIYTNNIDPNYKEETKKSSAVEREG